jgi:hypothetical protein
MRACALSAQPGCAPNGASRQRGGACENSDRARGFAAKAAIVLVTAAAILATAVLPTPAGAGPKSLAEQLVGTWTFISSINRRKDGSIVDRWGQKPKGIFMFDDKGNYAQMITRSDSLVFGSKTVANFGTYSVDEASGTLITEVAGSTSSKLNGTVQRRIISSLTADEFRYVNPLASSGMTVEAVWKRVK